MRKYVILAACYLFCGLAILFTHYLAVSPYNKAALDEKLTLVAASHIGTAELVDNLPALFRENAHAAALKLSDLRGNFLGAMYDARRMPASDYKLFLDTKIFDPQKPPLPHYALHTWESKRRHVRMVVLSLKRMQISEYLSLMSREYALHYLIPLFIVLGAVGLTAYHFYFAHNAKPLSRFPKNITQRKASVPTNAPPIARTKASAWSIKSGAISESTMQNVLINLRSFAGATYVSVFARTERQRWQSVIALHGSLIVRGDAVERPELLNDTHSEAITHSADRCEWLFFNAAAPSATLCFVLRFAASENAPSREGTERIAEFVRAHARALLVEHNYESSILDSESGLYSAPYAAFSLKEKILAGKPFAVAIFRFAASDFSHELLPKTARTAIRIMRENFTAEEAPAIARGQDNTIICIFQSRTDKAVKETAAIRQLYNAYTSLGKRFEAAAIEDAASGGGATRTLRMLERLLAHSKASGKLEFYQPGQTLQII